MTRYDIYLGIDKDKDNKPVNQKLVNLLPQKLTELFSVGFSYGSIIGYDGRTLENARHVMLLYDLPCDAFVKNQVDDLCKYLNQREILILKSEVISL